MNQNINNQGNENFDNQDEINQNQNINIGPIELSILERVESGLVYTGDETQTRNSDTSENTKSKMKYSGPKEIIFMTGWVNIDSIYKRYLFGFLSKAILGIYSK